MPVREFADLFAAADHPPAQFHGVELLLPLTFEAAELIQCGCGFGERGLALQSARMNQLSEPSRSRHFLISSGGAVSTVPFLLGFLVKIER